MDRQQINRIRKEFPVLSRRIDGRPLVYLDSAATALTPRPVIEAVTSYYRDNSANIHRGLYPLSEEATELYEGARRRVAEFLCAASAQEIIFTSGATDSINLVAHSWAERLGPEDRITVTEMEHHANLVPWQQCAVRRGCELDVISVEPLSGMLREEEIEEKIGEKTALVALTGMSNVTGIVPPIERIVRRAGEVGALVLLDASQHIVHENVNLRELDIDFLAFSGHKLYGPTGIGVLWAKSGLLDASPPYRSGGDMIETVSLKESRFRKAPHRFEAGTPHIAGAAGLAAAVSFLESLNRDEIRRHERDCTKSLIEMLAGFDALRIFGSTDTAERRSVVSFTIAGIHPHDAASILGRRGIALRAGLHCAQPYSECLEPGAGGSLRASLGIYNNREDIDTLRGGIEEVISIFHG
jgi:cysteine desulfurase / selenocysteine lyase